MYKSLSSYKCYFDYNKLDWFFGVTLAAYFSGFPLVVSLGLRHLGGASKLAAHRGCFPHPDVTPHEGVAFTRSFP